MCGIVGMAAAAGSAPPSSEVVDRAVAALHHRGPDGSGVHLGDRVALGHTRLSIIDVEGGAQPLANEDGSVVTVYNGEIWNHQRLRSRARGLRPPVPDAVRHRGARARLGGVGRSAPGPARRDVRVRALGRQREPAARLPATGPARSRSTSRRPAPGSRSARMRAPSCSSRTAHPEVDPDAVAGHLFQRYTVSPRTLFRGVERLEPGHLLVYDGVQARAAPVLDARRRRARRDRSRPATCAISCARPCGHG